MSSIEQENIENEFKLIIRKNFIETDKNIEMDLKNYSSDKDLLEYFFEKINLCSSENFEKIRKNKFMFIRKFRKNFFVI